MKNHFVYILDFNDSFTYNIASIIYKNTKNVRVIHHTLIKKFIDKLLKEKQYFQKNIAIIIGPGPGRPVDYLDLFSPISRLIDIPYIYFMGICLGHQIIWKILGSKITEDINPVHGKQIEFLLPDWPTVFPKITKNQIVKVQRYNSLIVKSDHLSSCIAQKRGLKLKMVEDGIFMTLFPNGVSYQFHPESIGTSFPDLFFNSLFKFLYNQCYEERFANRGHL